jgi:putative RecB family exonuclease
MQFDHRGRGFTGSNENNASTHGTTVAPIPPESELTVGPGIYCAGVTYLKLSPSKAAAWVDCPRRFLYTYVERRRSGRSWAHFSFGLSVHNALREWFDLHAEQRTASAVSDVMSRVWIDAGFQDPEQSSRWRAKAVEMVSAYVESLDPDFQPFNTERTLAFKTDHFIMEGRIDRIDAAGDHYSIVDYKTGKSIPDTDDVRGSQALAMYALMLQRALGKKCFDVSLHHLPSGQVVSWTHTNESLQRHLDRVSQIASDIVLAQDTWESAEVDAASANERIRDEMFPARPSALCGYCDHWDVCEVGQGFMERKQPWEGLAEEAG